jgi:acyl carrier protein
MKLTGLEKKVEKSILEIIKIIAPDTDISNLNYYTRFREQMDLDSMDFLDIVMELRKRYKIEVPKEEYQMLATMKSCIKYLTPKFKAMGYKPA